MEKIILFGDVDVNCYFIEDNHKCYIVDPGYEKERIVKYVDEHNLNVVGILLTHAHIDHIGAIDCFPVPIYLHKEEYEVLMDNHKNGANSYRRGIPYDLKALNIITIDEATILQLNNQIIRIIHTPGHTIGSVCYGINNDLYTGDTLFNDSVGRWDFPTGDLEALKRSVTFLIDNQDEKIEIHPGHGDSSTIKIEKENNYYYQNWKKSIPN